MTGISKGWYFVSALIHLHLRPSTSRRLRWADSQVAELICRAVLRRKEIEPISSREPIDEVRLGQPDRAATPVAIVANTGERRTRTIGRFVHGNRLGERRRTPTLAL